MMNFLITWFTLSKTNFWLALSLALTIVTVLLSIYIVIRFYRVLIRQGCSGYLTTLGLILVSIVVFAPQVVASILPKPWSTIFLIGWGIYFVFLLISWLIERGKPKPVLSVSAQTSSILMKPNCIFCGKPGVSVLEHTIEGKKEENGVTSYWRQVYPFPAHYDCYRKSLKSDEKNEAITYMSMLLGFIILVINLVIISRSEITPTEDKTVITTLGWVIPLFLSGITFLLVIFGVKTEDAIVDYCNKNRKK